MGLRFCLGGGLGVESIGFRRLECVLERLEVRGGDIRVLSVDVLSGRIVGV